MSHEHHEHRDMLDVILGWWRGVLTTGGEPASPPGSKAVTALAKVTDEAFVEAVRSLAPELRAPYEHHLDGRSSPEIAALLGIAENEVTRCLFDARRQLRALLTRVHTHTGRHLP